MTKRLILTALASCFVLQQLALSGTPVKKKPPRPLGRLERINLEKDSHPKAYHPRPNDLVECFIEYPVVPGKMVRNLRVTIDGDSVRLVRVVYTTVNEKIVGVQRTSAFILPRRRAKKPLAYATFTPVLDSGKIKPPIKIAFLVENVEKDNE